ncbi:hypothetical protein P1P75_06400 [Streptomyces sp. ID05-39B]|uniref:hypothetical protein n=1 Tax=Streptomyces sp. ID05-39B TaxID=3028664 RepID=UPI0029A42723|nr:hypothetical protein [Streptomyces sp. ID05-39B]MDX3526072.1 hypothetical protein [Streptomyces sp. ID05-39B]
MPAASPAHARHGPSARLRRPGTPTASPRHALLPPLGRSAPVLTAVAVAALAALAAATTAPLTAVAVAGLAAAWPCRPSPRPDVDIRVSVRKRASTGIGPPGSICGSDQ